MLPRMAIQEINKQLSIINRIVIHPKYRTIGLGEKLIHETLTISGTPYVEMMAVMAKYSPFAEKAGMKKIAKQHAIESILGVSKTLSKLGFDLQLLGSERYVSSKLESLNDKQMSELKTAFIMNKHPRFKKAVSAKHQPFGVTSDYVKYIQTADNHQLGKLIKVLAMLSQTKVYLFFLLK